MIEPQVRPVVNIKQMERYMYGICMIYSAWPSMELFDIPPSFSTHLQYHRFSSLPSDDALLVFLVIFFFFPPVQNLDALT